MEIIKHIIEQEQVSEFMRLTGQEIPKQPTIPSPAIQALRWGLIEEENYELQQAAIDDDIVEVADALCDLLYVVLGAFSAYGFNSIVSKELFDEVQRSNMSKTCANEEEAQRTIDKILTEDIEANPDPLGYETQERMKQYVMIPVGDKWVVNRVSDNKVMKSINYSKPDLVTILRKHGVNLF